MTQREIQISNGQQQASRDRNREAKGLLSLDHRAPSCAAASLEPPKKTQRERLHLRVSSRKCSSLGSARRAARCKMSKWISAIAPAGTVTFRCDRPKNSPLLSSTASRSAASCNGDAFETERD